MAHTPRVWTVAPRTVLERQTKGSMMSATTRTSTHQLDGADRHGRNPRPAPRRTGTRYAAVHAAILEG